MKVLIACEESQAVCIEMRKRGHKAYSCDILPASGGHPEWHIQDKITKPLLMGGCIIVTSSGKVHTIDEWDMIIAFPPCTYLCVSGLHWNKRILGRAEKTEEALNFVKLLLNANCTKIALENPISCISSRIRKPDQIIQPYQFGHDASKSTCLWLKNLPILKPTEFIQGRLIDEKYRWGNQTNSGQNKLGPSPDRAKLRSKTFPGIAKAMAEQWG